jgi:hypothetical protein
VPASGTPENVDQAFKVALPPHMASVPEELFPALSAPWSRKIKQQDEIDDGRAELEQRSTGFVAAN